MTKPTPEQFAALVLARLAALVRALVASGWPAMSAWWSDLLTRFMHSAVRRLVVRCGRRGGKSSTACMFAVAFALVYATLGLVPPGDTGWVVFVSVSREEADQRLRTIAKILTAIGVAFSQDGQTIMLGGTNIGFRVQACTVASVSGWTSILIIADEVATWMNRDDGRNPADEVLGHLRPTAATQPLAREFMLSSPLGLEDAHAVAFGVGDTAYQLAVHAPTWLANPTVSEAATHGLEPDDRKWSRQYAAIPQVGALAALDAAQIDRAMRIIIPNDWSYGQRIVLLDPTAGASDTYAYAVAGWRKQPAGGQSILQIGDVDGIAQATAKGVTSDHMVRKVVSLARNHSVQTIHSDQFEKYSLASAFQNRGFAFTSHTWSAPAKERCVEHVRGWLRDGLIALPNHDRLRHELLAFEERISPSGALTFRARQGGHDDYAMLVLLAALVDIEGGLSGTPTGKQASWQGYADWVKLKADQARGRVPTQLVVEVRAADFVPMTAPPDKFRCVVFQAAHATYQIGPDGLVSVHPDDIDSLRKLGFVDAA